jgi:hypothetical protein
LDSPAGKAGDGDESASGEIVAEYLPADLGQPIAVAHVGDEHGHLHHIGELAARFFEGGIEQLEDLPRLPLEVAGQRLAGIVNRRGLSGEPHGLTALGDHRLGIAALLRAFRLDEILGVQRDR